jgi:hypothetical protein
MTPGDVVKITFKNKSGEPESIKIGVTGSYYIDVGMDIIGVSLDSVSYGSMTYSYQFVKTPTF